MVDQFSVPSFFRRVPNAHLKRYFERQRLCGEVDFDAMAEAKPTALLEAWDALPDPARRAIEPVFVEIFEMASEGGLRAIHLEAAAQLPNLAALAAFKEKLASLRSHHERAVVTFLDHGDLWRNATRLQAVDALRATSWRKRRGFPAGVVAATDDQIVAAFSTEVGTWFRKHELRGHYCKVEVLSRGGRDYFFCFPQDFSDEPVEWVDAEFVPRSHTPAFQVVFAWSAAEGSLEVSHRGKHEVAEALMALFARRILGQDKLPAARKDERVYDLNKVRSTNFGFWCPPESGIESVRLRRMRLSSTVRRGDRVTLEAETGGDGRGIYKLVEKAGQAFPLELWNVTQVEIVAQLAARGDKRGRRVPFTVTWPNSCSLKHDETGLKLKSMLLDWGIELR